MSHKALTWTHTPSVKSFLRGLSRGIVYITISAAPHAHSTFSCAVAHVWDAEARKWWRCDDETVTEMPKGPVAERGDHGMAAEKKVCGCILTICKTHLLLSMLRNCACGLRVPSMKICQQEKVWRELGLAPPLQDDQRLNIVSLQELRMSMVANFVPI